MSHLSDNRINTKPATYSGGHAMERRFVLSMLAALPIALAALHAGAAEIKVLGGGPVDVTFREIAAAFARETGHKIEGTFSTVGIIQDKLKAGEKPDIIILTPAAMDELDKAGSFVAGTRVELGRAQSGLAVRAGAPVPDISTPEALKRTLLAARTVAYVDPKSTTGVFFASLLNRLQIADEVNKKAVLFTRGFHVADAIAEGKAEIGNTNISELVPNKGVKVVGPLPDPFGLVTPYLGAVTTGSANRDAARALLAALSSPAAREKFKAAGL
jgi:molybdate transport system substrate-binding protein